jgi:SAM-dependent methyltransferase
MKSGNPDGAAIVDAPMSVARNNAAAHVRPPARPARPVGRHCHGAYQSPPCAWAVDLLDVQAADTVLEVGFGPGAAIQLLSGSARHVAGVDPSAEMLRQARKRNVEAIGDGRVDLRQGFADHLPFAAESFDKAMAINSMQVWPDASAGLLEIRRVLKPGGRAAPAFTAHSGQRKQGVPEMILAARFAECRLVEADQAFCVLATR